MDLIDEAIYKTIREQSRRDLVQVNCCYNCCFSKIGKLCIQTGKAQITSPDSVCHNYKGWLDD